MKTIHVLSDSVINKISAGEVIERPASVVKELVENALDAQARNITVDFKKSGKRLIRVIDDGAGMGPDDALKSVERHATSKISEIDDLWEVATMGFRGEALASIGAVSETEIVTKRKEDALGTIVKMQGGTILEHHETGCSNGTSISVKNLFFNTPVRLKFLKTDQTERGRILDIVTTIALSNYHVGFMVLEEGREVLHAPPVSDRQDRVSFLFGKQFADKLVPLSIEREDIRIRGFIGKPDTALKNRTKQYFFVNNRPIKSPALSYALSEGYHELLPVNRFPAGVIFIDIDPQKIDVNIHPTKQEIRFTNARFVQSIVISGVRETFRNHDFSSVFKYDSQSADSVKTGYTNRVEEALMSYLKSPEKERDFTTFGSQKQEVSAAMSSGVQQEITAEEPSVCPLRVIGAIKNLYVLCEDAKGLVVVDQHAAHERVLYDSYVRSVSEKKVASQTLLLPVYVELAKNERPYFEKAKSVLNKAGFQIEDFDPETVSVSAVPVLLECVDIQQFVRDVIAEMRDSEKSMSRNEPLEEKIARIVCRRAVMANDSLSGDELRELMNQLYRTENPHTCPHGRPTMVQVDLKKLNEMFKRSGF